MGISERAYRWLLRAYPRGLRDEYGDEMARLFRDLCREKLEDGGGLGLAALWVRTLRELLRTAPGERLRERSATLNRNASRSVAGVALATALVLLVPLLAGRITGQVAWTLSDFVFAGTLVFGAGLMYVLAASRAGNHTAYRAAVGVALAAAFIILWAEGAVGINGPSAPLTVLTEVGVFVVGIVGALVARFRPRGMAAALFATSLAQLSAAPIALFARMHEYPGGSVVEIVALNGFFAAPFAVSALLFRRAGRVQTAARAGQRG